MKHTLALLTVLLLAPLAAGIHNLEIKKHI